MTEKQIQTLYEINGLTDYKLTSTEDLLKIHGIDYKEVHGYEGLDDLNRVAYEAVIINFFNAWGLEYRRNLRPTGIYWVKEIEYLFMECPNQEFATPAGSKIYTIDRFGRETLLHEWHDADFKEKEQIQTDAKQYLRFEYKHGPDEHPLQDWLHVMEQGKEWY